MCGCVFWVLGSIGIVAKVEEAIDAFFIVQRIRIIIITRRINGYKGIIVKVCKRRKKKRRTRYSTIYRDWYMIKIGELTMRPHKEMMVMKILLGAFACWLSHMWFTFVDWFLVLVFFRFDACLKFTPELNLMVLQNFNFNMNNCPLQRSVHCRPTRIQFQNESALARW